jgi:hypothetical protein
VGSRSVTHLIVIVWLAEREYEDPFGSEVNVCKSVNTLRNRRNETHEKVKINPPHGLDCIKASGIEDLACDGPQQEGHN